MSETMSFVLTHGWRGLGLAYAAVQAPMLAAMVRARSGLPRLLLSPAIALPLTAIAGAGFALFAPPSAGLALVLGGTLNAGLGYAAGRVLATGRQARFMHQRGARVIEGAPAPTRQRGAPASLREVSCANELTLAGQPMSASDETKHFKLIGTTGTGKSTAIRELLEGALRRGDRAVIADPDGGYLRRY